MADRAATQAKLLNYVSYALGEYYVTYPQIFEVLNRITSLDRKVLAIWAYKRYAVKKDIMANWTWDEDQIKAFEASQDKKDVDAAVKGVASEFASILEGHKLTGGAHPRSLSKQISYWNSRSSVGSSAHSLHEKLMYELTKDQYTDDLAGYDKFIELLSTTWAHGVIKEPTNAVPGLSAHGQMRAIDFHVKKDGVEVAGSGGAQHWIDAGYDAALKKAVKAYNNKKGREVFDGPLKSPNEPWHYNYIAL